MEELTNVVDWSRAQFALTAIYHWLFVPLTLGLGVIIAIMETIFYRTRDEKWLATTKFWMTLFGVNFAIGVATGIILEFEFGTNWSNYSWFVGDIFGAPLAVEGILAFFMESTFIAVMFFGWNRVSPKFHLAATWLTAIGASISAYWILVANAWMQDPVGCTFNPETMRNEMTSFCDRSHLAYGIEQGAAHRAERVNPCRRVCSGRFGMDAASQTQCRPLLPQPESGRVGRLYRHCAHLHFGRHLGCDRG